MRVTHPLLVVLTLCAAVATPCFAGKVGAPAGGTTSSAHKANSKMGPGAEKPSVNGKGMAVGPSAAGPGVSGSGSKRDAHVKKGNGSQSIGIAGQSPQRAGSVINTGRNAIAAKITNTNGTMQGGRTGLGTGVTKNVSTSMMTNGASVTQSRITTPRNAALITGTGMGLKGTAPPAIRPAARNSTSINGTGMVGKN